MMKERPLRFSFHLLSLLFAFALSSATQAQIILVVDELGIALPGVEITTRNFKQGIGTVTDLNGKADIEKLLAVDSTIRLRFLGYKSITTAFSTLSSPDYKVAMKPNEYLMEEVVVFGRRQVLQEEIPYQINTINAQAIASMHAQTTADALAQHGGVFVQKSQMGGGSPVIRGFEANRVLLVVDGVRMNNAIYRSGHLQNAITVDQAMLDRMDVIFGPNSLMYGSDALGGVVHYKTRDPSLSQGEKPVVKGQYYTRFASANSEKSAHFDLSIGNRSLGSLTSVTVSDYGDLRTGNNRDDRFPDFGKRPFFQTLDASGNDIEQINNNSNLQIGTGYSQLDVTQKWLYVPNSSHRLTANIQYSNSTDIPRYDFLTELQDEAFRYADWNYGPQQRILAGVDYRYLQPTSFSDQIVLIGAYQSIDEDRINRRWQSSTESTQEEDVSVWSFTADLSKELGADKLINLDYGIDFQLNDVNSAAHDIDNNSGQLSAEALTRYASGDNKYQSLGAYLSLNGMTTNEKWHYQLGARWSNVNYKISYDRSDVVEWPQEFYDGISGNNNALTWSVGGTWHGPKKMRIRMMVSTAFRSPNIDDLAKIRVNNDEITFPNLSLKPEQSFNAEIGINKTWDSKVIVSTTVFYTNLQDAIVRKSGIAPNGQSTWISQGETLNVVSNQNAQSATLYGISGQGEYKITKAFSLNGSINFVNGRERTVDGRIPLAHIPPLYGQVAVKWEKDRFNVNASYRFNGHKPLSEYGGSVDNPDLASPDGALAWQTLNIYSSFQLTPQFKLSLAIENLGDVHYRPFGSGVSAAGRNVIVGVSGGF